MILYGLLRLAILTFGYLPFWILYRFSDCLSFIFYYFGIRKKTIYENLRQAFEHKSEVEIKQIVKKVYRNFFDVMVVEMLKSFTMSSQALARRFDSGDLSLIEDYKNKNRSIIVVLGHYANWEWGVCVPHRYECVAFYKPIKNRYIDRYVRKNRARHQFQLASIHQPLSTFLRLRNQLAAYFLIADKQNFKKRHEKRVVWLPFLGKEAPFLLGPAKYAQSFNYPILYSQITRVGRGRYRHQLLPVAEDPLNQTLQEMTRRWVVILERQVIEDPSSWLWFWATTRSRQVQR